MSDIYEIKEKEKTKDQLVEEAIEMRRKIAERHYRAQTGRGETQTKLPKTRENHG